MPATYGTTSESAKLTTADVEMDIEGGTDYVIPPTDLAVVLLGRVGAGKSTVANVLAGNPGTFESRKAAAAVTTECKAVTIPWTDGPCGNFIVVDTPGYVATPSGAPAPEYMEGLRDMLRDSVPENAPLCMVLCLPLTGPVDTDAANAEHLEASFFGPNMFRQMVVVWTHRDALGDTTLQEFLGETPGPGLARVLHKVATTLEVDATPWDPQRLLAPALQVAGPLRAVLTGVVATSGRKKGRRQRQLEAGLLDRRAPGSGGSGAPDAREWGCTVL